MAKVKKNVFQEFMQDEYVPEGSQCVVKYLVGKGNNLHEVEAIDGSKYLVSMPKKFRQTVWLRKNDCIVVDPIAEGKKVLGEIVCVIPVKNVVELIEKGEWCPRVDMDKDSIINFYTSHVEARPSVDEFVPTDSEDENSSDLTDEEGSVEESDDEEDDSQTPGSES